MSTAEYAAWVRETIPSYAREKVASGAWDESDALEKAEQEFAGLLPDGIETRDNHLFAVLGDGDTQVGVLWFAVKDRGKSRIAYVYDIEIFPEHQRKGHAQRALLAMEDEARTLGLDGVALHVFGHNTVAQSLYAKLGYRPTNINLYKAVGTDT